MKIYIDGTIFTLQKSGGISRYVSELTKQLTSLGSQVTTLMPGATKGNAPQGTIKNFYLPIASNYLSKINNYLFNSELQSLNKGILHSSYFSLYPKLEYPIQDQFLKVLI